MTQEIDELKNRVRDLESELQRVESHTLKQDEEIERQRRFREGIEAGSRWGKTLIWILTLIGGAILFFLQVWKSFKS